FRRGARARDALFIVNDRPDVALAVGADGVHLGQDDLPPRWARRVLGDDALIGLSTHSEEQLDAVPAEVDYVCVGPVHETPTKPERAATGLGFVRFAAARASRAEHPRPWFAIGGINGATLPAVVSAGATRVVVVRAVTEVSDSAAAVRALQRVLGRDVGSCLALSLGGQAASRPASRQVRWDRAAISPPSANSVGTVAADHES